MRSQIAHGGQRFAMHDVGVNVALGVAWDAQLNATTVHVDKCVVDKVTQHARCPALNKRLTCEEFVRRIS